MQIYLQEDRAFYAVEDLRKIKSPCLEEANAGIIAFFKDKGLRQDEDYLFVQNRGCGTWFDVKEKYSRRYGTILISKEYVDNYVSPKAAFYASLPPLLKLKEAERFRDCEGIAHDIEVRGERHFRKCFFKASDIARVFDIPDLIKTICRDDSSYLQDRDYVDFSYSSPGIIPPNSINRDESTYLTYYGLNRAIMVSRTGEAYSYTDWMMETLFAAQFGTTKQKAKVASRIIGVDYETVKAMCGVTAGKKSVIYLLYLGKVKNLRRILSIPAYWDDEDSVYKYGRTNDIQRRYNDHLTGKYSREKGFETVLLHMWPISVNRCPQAENDLATFLTDNDMRLKNKNHIEIAIYPGNTNAIVKKIGSLFSEYERQIRILEDLVIKLENETAQIKLMLQTKDVELSNQIKKYKQFKKTSSKDLQIQSRKYKNLKKTYARTLASKETEYQALLATRDVKIQLLEKDMELAQAKYDLALLKA